MDERREELTKALVAKLDEADAIARQLIEYTSEKRLQGWMAAPERNARKAQDHIVSARARVQA